MRLEMKAMLVLAIASLMAMAYAIAQGDLWVAALGAFFGIYLLRFYLRYRQDRSARGPEYRGEA